MKRPLCCRLVLVLVLLLVSTGAESQSTPADTLYGIAVFSGNSRLVTVNPENGAFVPMEEQALDGITPVPGVSALDVKNRLYLFQGRPASGNTQMFIVNTPTGEVAANLSSSPLTSLEIQTPVVSAGELPATLASDFNEDGRIDFADFLLFVKRFNLQSGDPDYDARFDLDENGDIGFTDFVHFVRAFGQPS